MTEEFKNRLEKFKQDHNISEQQDLNLSNSIPLEIKGLTVLQPYANLISTGKKTIETRKWYTDYRGDILIHAGLNGVGEPKGVALCIVELIRVRKMEELDIDEAHVEFDPRLYSWILTNLRVFETPIPMKGNIGLFDLEIDITQFEYNYLKYKLIE